MTRAETRAMSQKNSVVVLSEDLIVHPTAFLSKSGSLSIEVRVLVRVRVREIEYEVNRVEVIRLATLNTRKRYR